MYRSLRGVEGALRFTFANQLRGFAAVCVLLNHLTGVYWSEPLLVASSTFAAVVQVPPPAFEAIAAGSWYNLGPFGVGLFFLISGFVIPMSLEGQSGRGFLTARAFRIYPTYFAAFVIELVVLALSARHSRLAFTLSAKQIVANAFLVTDIANVPSVDLVNWTLVVELKFYLLIAFFATFVRRGNVFVILAIAATILFVSRFSHSIIVVAPKLTVALRIFESNALYVLFMLIGVVFSYHVRKLASTHVAAASILLLFAMFVVCWPLTFFRGEFPMATYNYGYALLVFAGAYRFHRFIPDARIGDFFASISYPMYLLHALLGWSVMTALLQWHVPVALATLLAITAVLFVAAVVHVAVETPSQVFGKRLARRLFPMDEAAPSFRRSP